jgi:hypothetical protein
LLLITLVLWPLGAYSTGALAVWGRAYLAAIGLIGWFGGIGRDRYFGAADLPPTTEQFLKVVEDECYNGTDDR